MTATIEPIPKSMLEFSYQTKPSYLMSPPSTTGSDQEKDSVRSGRPVPGLRIKSNIVIREKNHSNIANEPVNYDEIVSADKHEGSIKLT